MPRTIGGAVDKSPGLTIPARRREGGLQAREGSGDGETAQGARGAARAGRASAAAVRGVPDGELSARRGGGLRRGVRARDLIGEMPVLLAKRARVGCGRERAVGGRGARKGGERGGRDPGGERGDIAMRDVMLRAVTSAGRWWIAATSPGQRWRRGRPRRRTVRLRRKRAAPGGWVEGGDRCEI